MPIPLQDEVVLRVRGGGTTHWGKPDGSLWCGFPHAVNYDVVAPDTEVRCFFCNAKFVREGHLDELNQAVFQLAKERRHNADIKRRLVALRDELSEIIDAMPNWDPTKPGLTDYTRSGR